MANLDGLVVSLRSSHARTGSADTPVPDGSRPRAWRRRRRLRVVHGSKHHLLVDGGGVPLAWTLTGGNRNEVTQLLELLDRVPPVLGRVGRPRRRPRRLIADRRYDHDKYRRLVWQRGVQRVIARRQSEHGSGLGRHRWVIERTFA